MATIGEPKYHDEEWLREKYWEEQLSQAQIGDKCGVEQGTIGYWMKKHGIDTQNTNKCDICGLEFSNNQGNGVAVHKARVHQNEDAAWRDKENLREMYWEERMTCSEIGDKLGVSDDVVHKWLTRFGIETRGGGAQRPKNLDDPKYLYEKYIEQEKSTNQIAGENDCSGRAVRDALRRFDIPVRSREESALSGSDHPQWTCKSVQCEACEAPLERPSWKIERHEMFFCDMECRGNWQSKNVVGKNHPQYDGGRFPYGAGWHENKKKQIRLRDQYRCQDCGMTQPEHLKAHDESLHVHHLKKAREIDEADQRNTADNLLTLCRSCHLGKWEAMAPLRPDTRTVSD